jgi:hypothetical protein
MHRTNLAEASARDATANRAAADSRRRLRRQRAADHPEGGSGRRDRLSGDCSGAERAWRSDGARRGVARPGSPTSPDSGHEDLAASMRRFSSRPTPLPPIVSHRLQRSHRRGVFTPRRRKAPAAALWRSSLCTLTPACRRMFPPAFTPMHSRGTQRHSGSSDAA